MTVRYTINTRKHQINNYNKYKVSNVTDITMIQSVSIETPPKHALFTPNCTQPSRYYQIIHYTIYVTFHAEASQIKQY